MKPANESRVGVDCLKPPRTCLAATPWRSTNDMYRELTKSGINLQFSTPLSYQAKLPFEHYPFPSAMHRHHLGPRGRPPSFRHRTILIGVRTSGRFDMSQKGLQYTVSSFTPIHFSDCDRHRSSWNQCTLQPTASRGLKQSTQSRRPRNGTVDANLISNLPDSQV